MKKRVKHRFILALLLMLAFISPTLAQNSGESEAEKAYAGNSEYGKRVIYQMNIGAFTAAGTFAAAAEKLQDLRNDLGVDVVWLMPVYPRGAQLNSPYAVTDFTTTKTSYGTPADLKAFVKRAHEVGIDVWLDWVPNHVAVEHPWVNSGNSHFFNYDGNTTATANSNPPATLPYKSAKTTIYVESEEQPYLYAYGGTSNDNSTFGAWPGIKMEREGIYWVARTDNEDMSIIINDGSSKQTADILGVSGTKYYRFDPTTADPDNNGKYKYEVIPNMPVKGERLLKIKYTGTDGNKYPRLYVWQGETQRLGGWPGGTVAKGADGYYTFTVYEGESAIVNNGSGGDGNQVNVPEIGDGNNYFSYDGGATLTKIAGSILDRKIYVQSDTQPYLYVWGSAETADISGSNDGEYLGPWPGTAMTKEGDYYVAELHYGDNAIINDGNGGAGHQATVDGVAQGVNYYRYDGKGDITKYDPADEKLWVYAQSSSKTYIRGYEGDEELTVSPGETQYVGGYYIAGFNTDSDIKVVFNNGTGQQTAAINVTNNGRSMVLRDSNGNLVKPYGDVVQLDYSNPKVGETMTQYLLDWVERTTDTFTGTDGRTYTAGIDGFRLDMVSSPRIPDAYWQSMSAALKAKYPYIQLLAETDLTDPNNNSHISTSSFQYDYAWGLNDNLLRFGESSTTWEDNTAMTNISNIVADFVKKTEQMPLDRMIYLTNHDVNYNNHVGLNKNSMAEYFGKNRHLMTVLEFTMPGMPLVYNGQELNGTLALNYFNDQKVDWTKTDANNNMPLLIKALADLKHNNLALRDGNSETLRGKTRLLNSYNHNVLAYERSNGNNRVMVILNLGDAAATDFQIAGATAGTWSKVLEGSHTAVPTTTFTAADDINVTSNVWNVGALSIPARGYVVYTTSAPLEELEPGIFFVTEDSWDDNQKHKMRHLYDDKDYQYYNFVIKKDEFDALNSEATAENPANKLFFKFREYYNYMGTTPIQKQEYFCGEGTEAVPLTYGGNGANYTTTAVNFGITNNVNNAFNITKTTYNEKDVEYYVINFRRSIANPNTGKVDVTYIIKLDEGYFLITGKNVTNSEEQQLWRFETAEQNPENVEDTEGLEGDLAGARMDLCSYTITQQAFDDYIPDSEKMSQAIRFRIRLFSDNSANEHYVGASGNVAKELSEAHPYEDNAYWEDYDKGADFIIRKRPDVDKYIIQLWRSSLDASGETRVRVVFKKTYNYEGTKIDEIVDSGEDIYLYNVDAQRFVYVGNEWGTMASLLYDDLGMKMRITSGATNENPEYKAVTTKLNNEFGTQLGIDDWSYDGNSTDPFINLDHANIYCDRNNGNRWIFEPCDELEYATTYLMKLYDNKDGRWHYISADPENLTKVQYEAFEGDKKPEDTKYYRWQIVKWSDLVQRLKDANGEKFGGASVDATFLMNDQGFTRSNSEPWQTNGATYDKDDIGTSKENGMYWNARITGTGWVYQDVKVPVYGVFRLTAYGFYSGSKTQMYMQYKDNEGNWSTAPQVVDLLNLPGTTHNGTNDDIKWGKAFYEESVLGIQGEQSYLNTAFCYVPENAQKDENGFYTIRVNFHKTANATGDYTAIDDVHLHYLGKSPFVLREDKSVAKNVESIDAETRTNVPVYLKRDFWVNKWNALVLPVSVTTQTLRQIFGEGVEVASPYGLDPDDPYTIRFQNIVLTAGSTPIEAGKFYIVRPTKLVNSESVIQVNNSTGAVSLDEKDATGDWGYYYDLGRHDMTKALTEIPAAVVNRVFQPAAGQSHNSIRFEGSFGTTTAPARSYLFASNGNMYHIATAREIGGFRFYIVDCDAEGNPITTTNPSVSITMGDFDEDYKGLLYRTDDAGYDTTPVYHFEVDNSESDGTVYDTQGRKVQEKKDLSKLPKGVYISGGKKFIVK